MATSVRVPGKSYECHLGYKCNSRCVFCFVPPEWKRSAALSAGLSFSAAAGKMYGMYAEGCRNIQFFGGEPTVRADLPGLCALAKKIGFRDISLFTNGMRLADPALAARLADAGLGRVNMSVHGHNAGIHDSLTRVPGAFDQVLRAIDNVRGRGIGLSLICVLNGVNHSSLPEYAEFFLDRGITEFHFFFLRYQGSMALPAAVKGGVRVSMSDCAASVKRAFGVFRRRGAVPPLLEHFAPCVLKGYEARMADFYRTPARAGAADARYTHPDGTDASVLDLAYKHRVKLKGCSACRYDRQCPGVEQAYLRLFGGGEFVPLLSRPRGFQAGWPREYRKTALYNWTKT